jgi:hypothetical protein
MLTKDILAINITQTISGYDISYSNSVKLAETMAEFVINQQEKVAGKPRLVEGVKFAVDATGSTKSNYDQSDVKSMVTSLMEEIQERCDDNDESMDDRIEKYFSNIEMEEDLDSLMEEYLR